jgi:hypothetical protein
LQENITHAPAGLFKPVGAAEAVDHYIRGNNQVRKAPNNKHQITNKSQ